MACNVCGEKTHMGCCNPNRSAIQAARAALGDSPAPAFDVVDAAAQAGYARFVELEAGKGRVRAPWQLLPNERKDSWREVAGVMLGLARG